MIALFSVVAASISLAPSVQSETIGMFTIETRIGVSSGGGFPNPYPVAYKIVSLELPTSDETLSFRLEDDGERYSAVSRIRPKKTGGSCGSFSNPLPTDAPPHRIFNAAQFLNPSCEATFTRSEWRRLGRLVGKAQRDFPKAFARFKLKVREVHGASTRRCLQYEYNNHGSFCARYSTGSI